MTLYRGGGRLPMEELRQSIDSRREFSLKRGGDAIESS